MSKPVILVAKTGGVFYTREYAAKGSPSGEQGETEGLVRYLVANRPDLRVIFIGQIRGELPCETFVPDIDGLSDQSSGDDQRQKFDEDWERFTSLLAGDEVIGMLCVTGYSPTWSYIDNPHYANIYATGIRYSAPILEIIHRLKTPRLLINNDPRTYPKDQEMSTGWPELIPAALLDQTTAEVNTVVGGVRYRRRSVWARCESWAYHIRRENTGEYPVVCIAHAHIGDGCKQRGRALAWDNVLGDPRPDNFFVYGKGWEEYHKYDSNYMLGAVKPSDVMDILSKCVCCPAVALDNNFYTGKVYVCEAQGCIPLLYGGFRMPFTWDPHGVLLDLRSDWRITKPGDLKRLVDSLWTDLNLREQMRDHWRKATRPVWDKLEQMLDDLLAGKDTKSVEWFNEYGGYRAG